ncbi:MAG: OmpA family protein [Betaproteobacteria bacterium]|jgi:OOP family OmpA-OmpF porin|nr:OmpA family protein [Betaproteobacteria bacterium]
MFKNARKHLLAAGLVVIAASASQAFAQSGMLANAPKGPLGGPEAYVNDARNQIVKNPYGLCWRTRWWTPATAVCECDKDLMPSAACTVAAAPMAPKPMAPKPAPMAPKPVTQKVTLSTDVLFDFDRYALKPEGKARLDELVGKIKGIALEVIIAVGHTDRIGSEAYNQKLSVRRAESVKAYMVSKGIQPNRIYTEGKGEKQPVKNCPNMKSFKDTVACLAPNRRVEVEVVGTRQ